MAKKLLLLMFLVVLSGCAHYVEFKSPDEVKYESAIPMTAAYYIAPELEKKMYHGRAASSGIANRWDVPIGAVVDDYTMAYLKGGFKAFSKSDVPSAAQGDIIILVNGIDYNMAGQAAHIELNMVVKNSSGKEVLNKTYRADGPSGAGRVFAGGAFAQKSAIRQSTHAALEEIYKKFMADLKALD